MNFPLGRLKIHTVHDGVQCGETHSILMSSTGQLLEFPETEPFSGGPAFATFINSLS